MTVGEIMNQSPVTVPLSETLAGAFTVMMDRRIESLPVVDEKGAYRGMFDFADIWELLLPKATMLGLSSLTDLAFVSDMQDTLRDKLKQAGPRPIAEFLDAQVQPVHPNTPVKEAILLLMKHPGDLPVVDRTTGRLVGMLSPWDVLERLR